MEGRTRFYVGMSCIVWCWWWSRVHKSALDWHGLPVLLHSIDGQCWYLINFNTLFQALSHFGWYFMMPDEDESGRENVDTACSSLEFTTSYTLKLSSPVSQQVPQANMTLQKFFCWRLSMWCQHWPFEQWASKVSKYLEWFYSKVFTKRWFSGQKSVEKELKSTQRSVQ